MGGLRGFRFAPRLVAGVLKGCGWDGPVAVREALWIDFENTGLEVQLQALQGSPPQRTLGFPQGPSRAGPRAAGSEFELDLPFESREETWRVWAGVKATRQDRSESDLQFGSSLLFYSCHI